jgi:hypothetical protein
VVCRDASLLQIGNDHDGRRNHIENISRQPGTAAYVVYLSFRRRCGIMVVVRAAADGHLQNGCRCRKKGGTLLLLLLLGRTIEVLQKRCRKGREIAAAIMMRLVMVVPVGGEFADMDLRRHGLVSNVDVVACGVDFFAWVLGAGFKTINSFKL